MQKYDGTDDESPLVIIKVLQVWDRMMMIIKVMMMITKVLQVWDRPPPSATVVSLGLSANTLIVSRHCGRS